jgi:hypothetical protein
MQIINEDIVDYLCNAFIRRPVHINLFFFFPSYSSSSSSSSSVSSNYLFADLDDIG